METTFENRLSPTSNRIAFLLDCIENSAPVCPDPAGGGCMGTYCARCAAAELRPLLEKQLGAGLPRTDLPFTKDRVQLLPLTKLERDTWIGAFTSGYCSHRDRAQALWEGYAAVMALRGLEHTTHLNHPAILAMHQEIRRMG